jgi:MFS family permease
MCFTFFFLVSNVYVDRHAPPHLRASAQGVLTFTVAGLGTLLGNWVGAQVLEANRDASGMSWAWFWLVPAVWAGAVFIFFVAFFRDDERAPAVDERADELTSKAVATA